MDRELLHHAVHRRRQKLKPGLLLGLDQLLGEADRLLLRLGELVGQGAPVFGLRLAARLAKRGDRRFRFLQMALLDAELLLLLDQQLQRLQIGDLRAQVLLHQRPAHVDARLDDRDHRLELVDGGRRGGLLGLLLRLLTADRGDLGAMLADLVHQKLALHGDQGGVGVGGRRKISQGIVPAGQRRAQAGDVELLGQKIAAQVIAVRRVRRRIELDQHVAGPDHLPVLHADRAHHARFERLDDLGADARHDLAGRRGHDVDRAPTRTRPAPRRTAAMRVNPIARPMGDGGVSTISSAAGRKASSSRRLVGQAHRRRWRAPVARASGLHGSLPAAGATRRSGHRP